MKKQILIRKQTGFTLAELLAVVIIIGLLTTLSVGYYNKSLEQSRFNEGLAAAATLAEAVARARLDYQLEGATPPTTYKIANLDVGVSNARACTPAADNCALTKYFQVWVDGSRAIAYRGTQSNYDYAVSVPVGDGSIRCIAKDDDSFCESLGYVQCTEHSCTKPIPAS